MIEQNLGEIIKQIRDLDYQQKIEVVISDNCSTDGTTEKIKKMMRDAPDILWRYFLQTENVGMIQNILEVCRQPQGEFVVIVGDDCFARSAIRNMVQSILETPEVDFILLKNSINSQTDLVLDATTDTVFQSFEMGYLGNFVMRRSLFLDRFTYLDEAKKSTVPHAVIIGEHIEQARKKVDRSFVAINWSHGVPKCISQSWLKYGMQCRLDMIEIALVFKSIWTRETYQIVVEDRNAALLKNMSLIRTLDTKWPWVLSIIKQQRKLQSKYTYKIYVSLLVHLMPIPIFYFIRMGSRVLKCFVMMGQDLRRKYL